MSLRLVTRLEFDHALSSKLLWGIVAAFVGMAGVIALGVSGAEEASAVDFLVFFGVLGGELVVPVVGLVAGYSSVVGERESGSIYVLGGLPHSRRDVVLGKLLGRTAVVAVATVVAFVAAAVLTVAIYGSLPVEPFLGMGLLTLVLGTAFVGIAVGVSAASATRGRAMAGAVGSYFLFALLWEPLVAGVHYLAEGELAGATAPAWYFLLKRLSPISAYNQAANGLLDPQVPRLVGWYSLVEDVPPEVIQQPGGLDVAARVAGDLPVLLSTWVAVLLLAAWAVVAVAVGYRRFENADIT